MPNTGKNLPKKYKSGEEEYLYVDGSKFIGINEDGDHNLNRPGEFRRLNNLDIYANYIRTRRGLGSLQNVYNFEGPVLRGCNLDTGDVEYRIYAQNVSGVTSFYYKALNGTGEFTRIPVKGTTGDPSYVEIESDTPPDMLAHNGFVYISTQNEGAYVVENNESGIEVRQFGLDYPYFAAAYTLAAGSMTGTYVFGIELVYQLNGGDKVASTPNRKDSTNNQLMMIDFLNQKVTLTVDSSTLPSGGGAGDYWTHVRVYMSKRIGSDFSDPNDPITYSGQEGVLYRVALVDRATLEGNSYQIEIDVNDQDVNTQEGEWGLDRIELSPLPSGGIMAIHQNKFLMARVNTSLDDTESKIYFSKWAGTQYAEMWFPRDIVNVETGDGQKTIKMISLDNNLIIFKEAKTCVLYNGNTDKSADILDNSIGVSHMKLAAYIPRLGIVALTSDDYNLKIFGRNLQWTNVYNKLEISRQVKSRTRSYAANANFLSFTYCNGKLFICNGGGVTFDYQVEFLVLHVEQGKGWTTYTYGMGHAQDVFTFANNSRMAVISTANPPIELEKFEQYNDGVNIFDDSIYEITTSISTWMFQNNKGQDLLTMHYLKTSASLNTEPITSTIYVNGNPWRSIEDQTFTPNPTDLLANERSGIFRLATPQKPKFPFMYATMETTGDVTYNFIKWIGLIDKDLTKNYLNQIRTAAAPIITQQPDDVTVDL